jgi:hypothetical protein
MLNWARPRSAISTPAHRASVSSSPTMPRYPSITSTRCVARVCDTPVGRASTCPRHTSASSAFGGGVRTRSDPAIPQTPVTMSATDVQIRNVARVSAIPRLTVCLRSHGSLSAVAAALWADWGRRIGARSLRRSRRWLCRGMADTTSRPLCPAGCHGISSKFASFLMRLPLRIPIALHRLLQPFYIFVLDISRYPLCCLAGLLYLL